jgi:hypothetical protein
MPADNVHRTVRIRRDITRVDNRDSPMYLKLTQEDGNVAWTSPIYFFR